MKEVKLIVKFKQGLHARPAVGLISIVKQFSASVTLEKDGEIYAANSITSILSAGIAFEDEIVVRVQGTDEDTAIYALEQYFYAA